MKYERKMVGKPLINMFLLSKNNEQEGINLFMADLTCCQLFQVSVCFRFASPSSCPVFSVPLGCVVRCLSLTLETS